MGPNQPLMRALLQTRLQYSKKILERKHHKDYRKSSRKGRRARLPKGHPLPSICPPSPTWEFPELQRKALIPFYSTPTEAPQPATPLKGSVSAQSHHFEDQASNIWIAGTETTFNQ